MNTIKSKYNCIVGYSGHEQMLEPTVAAAVMGAKVIERHVTLSHDLWGTDQKSSLAIGAMDILYKRIMNSLDSIGTGTEKSFDVEEQEKREKLRG